MGLWGKLRKKRVAVMNRRGDKGVDESSSTFLCEGWTRESRIRKYNKVSFARVHR